MDYPTFRPVTKPSYKQQTSHRNNFVEHNYNYVNGPKQQNLLKQILKTPSFHKVKKHDKRLQIQYIVMINHNPHKNKVEITHFFNKTKIIQTNTIPEINLNIIHKINFHQMMKNTIIKTISNFTQAKNLVLTVLTNDTHEMNKYDNLEKIQHLTTIFFLNNKTQLTTIIPTNSNAKKVLT